MRAPVVPTHGWPAGTTEARDPNWAWRAFMVRDEREEFPTTPTAVSRTTPVELPARSAVRPSIVGWHAAAARRMAYGRVFCFLPNVGVVTFEKDLAGSVGGAARAGRRAAADAPMPDRLHAGGPAAVHRPQGVADAARRRRPGCPTVRASSATAAGAATTAIRRSSCCCTPSRGCGSAPPASSAPTGSSPAARWWSTTSCARRC